CVTGIAESGPEVRFTSKHAVHSVMSASLERKPFSASELLGGGVALATIALIALGGLRLAPSPNALPAPTGYASVSIRSTNAPAGFPPEQPRKSSAVAEAARDGSSPSARLGSGKSAPSEFDGGTARQHADRSAAPDAEWPAGMRL